MTDLVRRGKVVRKMISVAIPPAADIEAELLTDERAVDTVPTP